MLITSADSLSLGDGDALGLQGLGKTSLPSNTTGTPTPCHTSTPSSLYRSHEVWGGAGREGGGGCHVVAVEGGLLALYLILQSCSSERRASAVGGGEEGGAPRTADCVCV